MDGILLFNKPILWTSHDAVDFIRRRTAVRRVGHAGTLDPMATGLLILLVGAATKLSSEFSGKDKDYRGVMSFGIKTDTQDLEGRILSKDSFEPINQELVAGAFASLVGPQSQKPPIFSAVRKNGRKLYEYSRQGIPVNPDARPIHVFKFTLERFLFPEAYFFLSCSKGTYVRALCEAVGERCGMPAVLSALVRTRIGAMTLEEALTASQIQSMTADEIRQHLIPGRVPEIVETNAGASS